MIFQIMSYQNQLQNQPHKKTQPQNETQPQNQSQTQNQTEPPAQTQSLNQTQPPAQTQSPAQTQTLSGEYLKALKIMDLMRDDSENILAGFLNSHLPGKVKINFL